MTSIMEANDDPPRPADPPRRHRWRTALGVVCWVAIAGWGAFTLIRILGLEHTWYLDQLMAFTPWIALGGLLPVALALALRRWYTAAIAGVVVIALGTLFIPRAFGSPDPGRGPRIRVMSQNMKIGAASPAAILALVRSAKVDVLALEEYTPEAETALQQAGIDALLPYRATHPLPYAVGSAVYSRYPLTDTGYQPLAGGFGQEYATVTVPGAAPFEVFAVHTRAPVRPATLTHWRESIAQEPAPAPQGQVRILAGDFNATFDQVPLRRLVARGWTDAATRLGDGMETTWPYDGRGLPPITIDHVLVDPRVGVVAFRTSKTPATDHKAIVATLTLPPA